MEVDVCWPFVIRHSSFVISLLRAKPIAGLNCVVGFHPIENAGFQQHAGTPSHVLM